MMLTRAFRSDGQPMPPREVDAAHNSAAAVNRPASSRVNANTSEIGSSSIRMSGGASPMRAFGSTAFSDVQR